MVLLFTKCEFQGYLSDCSITQDLSFLHKASKVTFRLKEVLLYLLKIKHDGHLIY